MNVTCATVKGQIKPLTIICEEYESCVTGPPSFEMFDLPMVQCHKKCDILTEGHSCVNLC